MRVFTFKKSSSEGLATTEGEAATSSKKPTRMERLRLVKKGKQQRDEKQQDESQPMWSFGSTSDDKDVKEQQKTHSPGMFKSRSKDSSSEDNRDAEDTVVHARSESSSKLSIGKIFGDSRTQIKAVYNSFGETDVVHVEKEEDVPTIEGSNHVLIKVQVRTVQTKQRQPPDFI